MGKIFIVQIFGMNGFEGFIKSYDNIGRKVAKTLQKKNAKRYTNINELNKQCNEISSIYRCNLVPIAFN